MIDNSVKHEYTGVRIRTWKGVTMEPATMREFLDHARLAYVRVARRIGISKATMIRRLNDGGWLVREQNALADYLDEIDVSYDFRALARLMG